MADETTTTATTDTTTQADTTAGGAGGDQQQTTTTTTLLDGKTTDQKGVDEVKDGKAEGDKQTEKDAKPAGAPEKYEFKLADGSPVDAGLLGEFEPLFREANLPQEAAQKLVDKYASIMQNQVQGQTQAWVKQVQDWGVAAKADQEIGGEGGAAFTANLQAANVLLAKYGTPELVSLLGFPDEKNPTGLGVGNHPEFVRFMVRLAKAASEDRQPDGGTGDGKDGKSLGQKFYPDMNP